MQTRLPDKINPWKLAAAGGRLQGEIPVRNMARLKPLLCTAESKVSLMLQAGVDGQHIYFIAGHIETAVKVICQRCLGPMPLPLAADFRLGLVRAQDQAGSLPDEYDPLVVPEGELAVVDFLEDELILALPLAPRHEELSQCQAHGFILPRDPSVAETRHPFAALATLTTNTLRT